MSWNMTHTRYVICGYPAIFTPGALPLSQTDCQTVELAGE